MGSSSISFKVGAVPIAQPRQRHTMIAGRPHNYTPSKHPVNQFKAACQFAAKASWQGGPLDGPLSVEMEFVLPRPKNKIWKTKPMPREDHDKKPDLDNLCKSVKDALSKVLWRDDSQISQLSASKSVASGEEAPHVVVTVSRTENA